MQEIKQRIEANWLGPSEAMNPCEQIGKKLE